MFLDYDFLIKCFDLFFPFRNFRSMAYNQYPAWVQEYEILGCGNRTVIPACITSRIRREFPSPINNYTGFKEFVDLEV